MNMLSCSYCLFLIVSTILKKSYVIRSLLIYHYHCRHFHAAYLFANCGTLYIHSSWVSQNESFPPLVPCRCRATSREKLLAEGWLGRLTGKGRSLLHFAGHSIVCKNSAPRSSSTPCSSTREAHAAYPTGHALGSTSPHPAHRAHTETKPLRLGQEGHNP